MKKKALIIGGGAVALVAVIVALILIFTGGENAYRSIKVFEIDGSCTVERKGDSLDAFKNMALASGDTFTVGEGSFARLKLDDDKYVYLEANTRINLTATGTANDSKTMVYIERGSMLTEVKKKLSATSSYDIVTPNTTMSIRGTKTLTEVYEDLLGAIKTSAAVVEGQVKFSTIQKDKTGKAVVVSTDLGVGEGLGVTTDSKDLLSQDDVKHIVDDGKTVDGQTVEETTHEELGTVLETPEFSEEFLTNVVAVLARSKDEDSEEGSESDVLTEDDINDAINVLTDVISGNITLPEEVEEYIVNSVGSYYNEPIVVDEPVVNNNDDAGSGQVTPENNLEPAGNDMTVTGDESVSDDTTGENPVDDDREDTPADADNEQTEDDQQTGEDDSDEADEEDEDKSEEGESEEERIAREEKERLEKEEAERLEKEEQDKKDKEEKERLEKEEKEKKEKEEKERLEKEEKEKKEKEEREKAEKEAAEREALEAAEREEAERLAREQAERDAAGQTSDSGSGSGSDNSGETGSGGSSSDNGGGTGSGGSSDNGGGAGSGGSGSSTGDSTDSENVTITWSGTSHSYQASSSDEAQAKPYKYGIVTLTFKSGTTTLSGDAVPTSFDPGAPLPGTSDSPYIVEVDEVHAPYYEFEGWYTTENSANNMTSSQRLESVPATSSTEGYSLWAAFKPREYTLTFVNKFPEIGTLIIPSGTSGDGLSYSAGSNGSVVVTGLHYGDLYYLPEVERLAKVRHSGSEAYKSYPYISVTDGAASVNELQPVYRQPHDLICFSKRSDVNAAKLVLTNEPDNDDVIFNPVMFNHAHNINADSLAQDTMQRRSINVGGNDTVYMYFGTSVDMKVNDAKITLPGGQAQTLASVTEASQGAPLLIKTRTGSSEQYDEYWLIRKTVEYGQTVYAMSSLYFGAPLHLPNFSAPEGANPVYTDFKVESSGLYEINADNKYLYSRSTFSTETPLFPGTGTQHPFPVYNTSNTTELSSNGYAVEVNSREYAILDMSGADYHYFYEYATNNIEDLGNGKFKTALISCKSDGSGFTSYSGSHPYSAVISATCTDGQTYNREQFLNINKGKTLVALPDDLINPWYLLGGTRTGDYTTFTGKFNTAFSMYYPYVAKQNYRLVGYDLSYTIEGGETKTEQMLLNSGEGTQFYVFKTGDYGGNPAVMAGTNVLELSLQNTPASPVTIKPRFAPVTPFTVTTESIGANMGGDNSKLIFSNIDLNYVSEITVGADYTSNTNLTPNETDAGNAQGMNYLYIIYTDDSQKLMRAPLLGSLRYNKNTGKFDHVIYFADDYSSAPVIKNSYDIVDGTLSVPIFDLAYISSNTGTTAETLRVITLKSNIEDNTYRANVSALNQFVNKERKMHFTYSTTEAYGDKWVTSKESMITSDISTYDPLASQVYLTYNGYPQYIFAGCKIDIELYIQREVFCLEDVLKDMGVIGPDATGTKIYSITSSADAGVYLITDSTYDNDLTQSGSIPSDGYLASGIYIIPKVNQQTRKIPTGKEWIRVSYTNEDTSVSINVMSLLTP